MNEFPESSVPAFRPPEGNTRFLTRRRFATLVKLGLFTRLKYLGFPDFERDLNLFLSLTDESLFRKEVFGGDQGRSSVHLKHQRNKWKFVIMRAFRLWPIPYLNRGPAPLLHLAEPILCRRRRRRRR